MRLLLAWTLAVALVAGLALLITGRTEYRAAGRMSIAPEFDLQIALDAQHILLIHNGPRPTCASIPNPPQHDCFWPGPERRAFSVDYLTPHGVRSLCDFITEVRS
jgi:hypothetical protein